MNRKLGVVPFFLGGELGPHLDPSSHLATMDMDRLLGRGAPPPFRGGELGPHLTQSRLVRGLPSYQVAS